MRDTADARRLLERAIELDPALWDPYAPRGVTLLFAQGRTEQPLHSFERARELAPNTFVPHLFIAFAHLPSGQLIAARESLQRALRLNPRKASDVDVLMARATISRLACREDEAVQIWEQLRAENPDAIPPRLELARHYQAAGRHDEAHALIQDALQVNPELSAEALSRRRFFRERSDHEEYLRNLQAAGLP